MYIHHIIKSTALFIAILVLSSCGGGSSSGGESGSPDNGGGTQTPETLSLKVGNVNLGSGAILPRATITISGNKKEVAEISTNKVSTITISGGLDNSLFEILDANPHKKLAFKVLPDRFNPADSNADGIYEVDIKAADEDGQTVTFKAAYKIIIPRSAKDILSGKTFYTTAVNNEYEKVTYSDTSKKTTQYNAQGEVANSVVETNITYNGLSFTFDDASSTRITCQVSETPKVSLSCEDEGQTNSSDISYLTEVPALTLPGEYTLAATPEQVSNTFIDLITPKIESFSITGNMPIENDKVVISKSVFQGQFVMKASSFRGLSSGAPKVWFFLSDGDVTLQVNSLTDSLNNLNITKVSCVYNNSNNGGVSFTCLDLEIDNSVGANDTVMKVGYCNKNPFDHTNAKCNTASLPVLFVD